jgi:hypothetical protein
MAANYLDSTLLVDEAETRINQEAHESFQIESLKSILEGIN